MLLNCGVREDSWESLGRGKEIQLVNLNGNQYWVFIGRTDAEAETPIFWPPDVKNWFIWKDTDAGKDWRREEKGTTEIAGWHHRLNGHEFEKTLGLGDGQGGLVCCSPWGHKESHWLSDWTVPTDWLTKSRNYHSSHTLFSYARSMYICILKTRCWASLLAQW